MPKKSKYAGVFWHPLLKRWVVQVTVFVAAFDDEDQAGAVRGRLDRETEQIHKLVRRVAFGGTEPVRDDPGV